MDAPQPKRPWWRKRRWHVAVAAWVILPAAYALGVGPAAAAANHGWLPPETYRAAYRPLWNAGTFFGFAGLLDRYCFWWTVQTQPRRAP